MNDKISIPEWAIKVINWSLTVLIIPVAGVARDTYLQLNNKIDQAIKDRQVEMKAQFGMFQTEAENLRDKIADQTTLERDRIAELAERIARIEGPVKYSPQDNEQSQIEPTPAK